MKITKDFVGYITDNVDSIRNILEALEEQQNDTTFEHVTHLLYQVSLTLDTIRNKL